LPQYAPLVGAASSKAFARDTSCSATTDRPCRGRPKDASKREAILKAAECVFFSQGFEGTSLDSIASMASVSKLTVYGHFGSKNELFVETARLRCEQLTASVRLPRCTQKRVRDRILAIARALFAAITNEDALAFHRIIVANLPQLSHLTNHYWKTVPRRLTEEVVQALMAESKARTLHIEDPERTASQFISTIKGDFHARLLLGCVRSLKQSDIDSHLRCSVDLFLRAYASSNAG